MPKGLVPILIALALLVGACAPSASEPPKESVESPPAGSASIEKTAELDAASPDAATLAVAADSPATVDDGRIGPNSDVGAPPTAAEARPSPVTVPSPTAAAPAPVPATAPADEIDRALKSAIGNGLFPGATVLVSRDGQTVKRAAYGHARLYGDAKAKLAAPSPTRTDTIFDIASLTKVFTATYAMQLVEAGRLELDRPVVSYLPAFDQNGKERITVRQLLSHTSGLPPGLALASVPGGRAERLARVSAVRPQATPGSRYVYSDLNYIVLGQLVETVSGQSLADYGRSHVFEPLGMADTGYNPPAAKRGRIAATENLGARGIVWGEVHDSSAWALGGAAGHAGLFSTADDLARFGEALLRGGERDGARILGPESVRAMTIRPSGAIGAHALGFEVGQSWYMGALASPRAYGHTGYTGTSLVIDAERNLVVVLLTNRVHPTSKGPSINSARQAVATAAPRLAGG